MTVTIVGAGLAGLLAANMLKHHAPTVHEAQPDLPNNHSAVLRFRTSAVGDVLNIPFRKVTMIKDALPWCNPIADAMAYARKCTGTYRSDRSITMGLTVADRWIAPSNLIPRMAAGCDIKFNSHQAFETVKRHAIISTIPMPALMIILGYQPIPDFQYSQGTNIRAVVPHCDAYVSLLVPDPDLPFARISVTRDELIVEICDVIIKPNIDDYTNCADQAAELIGVSGIIKVTAHPQKYAKILPIDDEVRKDFMHWATDKFDIFSLGRYATWRPGLLLDDLVQDIRKIDGWIQKRNRYDVARSR